MKGKIIALPYPPSQNLKLYYKKHILMRWRFTQNSKLKIIKDHPIPWKSSFNNSRRLEIIITPLRITHTNLTHSHLCSKFLPPNYPYYTLLPKSNTVNYKYHFQALTNCYNSVSRVLSYVDATNISHLIWNESLLELNRPVSSNIGVK